MITEKKFCIFSLLWICWHWGLLLFALATFPLRKYLMISALAIDAVCFIIWIYLVVFKFDDIRSNRWKRPL